MAKARTDPEVRDAVVVATADLIRHVAQRKLLADDDPKQSKLPTRKKNLPGLDAIPPEAAAQLVEAAPDLAELFLSALEADGYVVIPSDWLVE